MKVSWLILDREGNPKDPSSFPPRPKDSNPEDGNPYTPWHRQEQHVHIENDQIDGIHGLGTLEEQQAILNYFLIREGESFQSSEPRKIAFLSQKLLTS